MKLRLFDFHLPQKLIAQKPNIPRDHSRLLVYDKKSGKIDHNTFFNLPKYLEKGDLLVFNNSKVLPARLLGNKETGGAAEALLLKEISKNEWEAMLGTRRPKLGLKINFKKGLIATVTESLSNKTWVLQFNFSGQRLKDIFQSIGQVPLPPYIHSSSSQSKLKKQYQTIYAKTYGSAAAPTAGLHFTPRLLKKLKQKGINSAFVTLHVGLGTFMPVNTENIEDFQIHHEYASIDQSNLKLIKNAIKSGQKIIAVGTTSVRTLEALVPKSKNKQSVSDFVDIYIYPGYKYQVVDAMITNFHLPKSSLLMLVSAFIGTKNCMNIYKKAIKLKYRFFSFGDGMLLK
jgi:S-adenosylmethionine:tRNA ribosyltransferase-isomerase